MTWQCQKPLLYANHRERNLLRYTSQNKWGASFLLDTQVSTIRYCRHQIQLQGHLFHRTHPPWYCLDNLDVTITLTSLFTNLFNLLIYYYWLISPPAHLKSTCIHSLPQVCTPSILGRGQFRTRNWTEELLNLKGLPLTCSD